nr:Rhodanese-like domain-containing protein [Ipomoea batatas]
MSALCLSRRSHGYAKMEAEDPEETSHRRAQFLIYKSLQKADSLTQRRRSPSSSCLKLRVFRLKIRIGRRLKRLRKSISLTLSAAAKGGVVCRQVSLQLKSWRRFLRGSSAVVPPLLNITAEARDSLKKSQSPENASQLKPLQVLLHFSLHKIYPNCAPTMIHQDRLRTRAPPRSPQSHTYKTSHVRKMCRIRVAPEMPKTKRADAEATVLDSPSKRRICLEKRYVAMRGGYVVYMEKKKKINYHNSIGQELNTIIPKGSSSKLEISKMAAEDLSGHGGNIVEQVNDDGRRRQAEQIPQLNGGGLLQPSQVGQAGVGECVF